MIGGKRGKIGTPAGTRGSACSALRLLGGLDCMPEWTRPILLIEDDLSLGESLCQFLRDHGYQTVQAATTREGWEIIRQQKPPLCLLDMNLPDGSGLEVLRRIVRQGLAVRVVVMTAFDLLHMRPADAGTTLAGWMTKPVNPAELLEVVEKVMGRRDDGTEERRDEAMRGRGSG